eukprot:75135_1
MSRKNRQIRLIEFLIGKIKAYKIHAKEQSSPPTLSNYTNTNYTNYISINYTHLDVNVLHQTRWNFIIKTDERFAIHTIYDKSTLHKEFEKRRKFDEKKGALHGKLRGHVK